MRHVWAGLVVGLVGTVAGIVAAVGGQALGIVAAIACVTCCVLIVMSDRRTQATLVHARLAEVTAGEVATPGEVLAVAGPETVFDRDTGLLDHRVFSVTFERKVAAARRHLRPLSLVLVDIAVGLPADGDRAAALAAFGDTVNRTLRESDISCRVGETTFGLILEDTPEHGGVWVAERLQIAVSCSSSAFVGPMRAAVATYPNHGLRAEEVLKNATAALTRAVSQPAVDGDRFAPVEVPSPEL